MGSAVVNKLSKLFKLSGFYSKQPVSKLISMIDLNKTELSQMKNEALEKLNRLEKMINKKIDQGVANLLERRVTIQNNPFFKKKIPIQGLHDLKETLTRTKQGPVKGHEVDYVVKSTVVTHRVSSFLGITIANFF